MRETTPDAAVEVTVLTRGLRSGEETAFRRFYELYGRRLFRYLLVAAQGQEDLAKEAMQRALLRLARHARLFDSEQAFWSWLTVLARTALIDEQRKRGRYVGLLDRFLKRESTDAPPGTSDADERLLAALHVQLAALTPDERDLLTRKYLKSETMRDIAEAVRTSEKAVESRLTRARRRLKDLILTHLDHEITS